MTPNSALTGKPVLVTGANSRIGRQIAIAAARHGAHVAVHYLENTSRPPRVEHSAPGVDAAEAVVTEIRSLGQHAVAIGGDLAQPETAHRILARAEDELGP